MFLKKKRKMQMRHLYFTNYLLHIKSRRLETNFFHYNTILTFTLPYYSYLFLICILRFFFFFFLHIYCVKKYLNIFTLYKLDIVLHWIKEIKMSLTFTIIPRLRINWREVASKKLRLGESAITQNLG